eukprot:gene28794-37798_t
MGDEGIPFDFQAGSFYVNAALEELLFDELRCSCASGSHGGLFLPAVRQLATTSRNCEKVESDSISIVGSGYFEPISLNDKSVLCVSNWHRPSLMTYLLWGYAWAEDKEHCEEFGRMLQADPSKKYAAAIMGIDQIGQVATDSLTVMDAAMMRDGIVTDDGQLACLHQDSLQAPDDLDIGVVYDVSNNIANVNSTMYTCHNAGT